LLSTSAKGSSFTRSLVWCLRASGAATSLNGSELLGEYLGDPLRMHEVATIIPLIPSLEQTAHDVEHEQREHGSPLLGL
jgi:hypothetical protein